jgi:valyl-tRNA synthetase
MELGKLVGSPGSKNLINAGWPAPFDTFEKEDIDSEFLFIQDITRAIREVRADRSIPPKQELDVTIKPHKEYGKSFDDALRIASVLAGVKNINIDPQASRTPGSASKVVSGIIIYVHDIIEPGGIGLIN